jgi:alkylation response protein AidB-like acyl-CoA dehydrogenase
MLPRGAKALLARTPKHKGQRNFIAPAYNLAKSIMPKISDTERAALQAGTIKFDRDLFSGDPTLKHLTETYKPQSATPEEQKFLDNEVNTLCEMTKTYEVQKNANLSPETWKYIRQNKFMGLMIKKNFGGMGMTAHGHAKVVEKISGRDQTACVTVMVPNSLGPGELLAHYGTQEQKDFYLPRLADGIDIPCFGLTGPSSGSDAASMRDEGIVCMKDGVLGISVSCNKRYITLAPVATLVGLAFKLKDPDGLLTKGKEGITVALLPTQPNKLVPNGIPGLKTGPRHDPYGSPFMNGTVKGENFFVPMSCIIGGEERAGYGWNMLMECLGEGRGISLPAGAIAASKLAVLAVGGSARIRKQFKVPIAAMQGVQEKLAVIGTNTFAMIAAQNMFNSYLANGEKPSCLSAVMKQMCTERGRISINEACDVMGGAAICNGPANFIAGGYGSIPISITVEGANVLTRSLIIFGQGLTRSHPHLLGLIQAIEDGNDLAGFNRELANIIKHAFTNLGRSITRGLGAQVTFRGGDILAYHEAHMSRLAANFAFCADCGLTMGGGIKTAEFISGRYADVLMNLYLGYSVMWFYKNNKDVQGLDKVFDATMTKIRYDIQEAFMGIFGNFPIPGMGLLMQLPCFPRGREYQPPTDKQRAAVSDLISTPTPVRDFLTENVFVSKDPTDRVAMIAKAAPMCFEADQILARCRKEGKREPTKEEQAKIDAAEAMREQIIQVDSFPKLAGQEHNAEWMKPDWGVTAQPKVTIEPAEGKQQSSSA